MLSNRIVSIRLKHLVITSLLIVLFLAEIVWFCFNIKRTNRRYAEENSVLINEINYLNKEFEFQLLIEGQSITEDIQFCSLQNDETIGRQAFLAKYTCIFYLTETGCNDCFMNELNIIREALDTGKGRKQIAIITQSKDLNFINRLTNDYAPDFDVFRVETNVFSFPVKVSEPFFFRVNEHGTIYNAHKSDKLYNSLTYIYFNNLRFPQHSDSN